MKAFDVRDDGVADGIPVSMEPYPKVVLGEGGHKRATWVAIGRQDQERLIDGETLRIFDAAVIVTKKGKPLIVASRIGGDDRALVLWRVESGYRGSASIDSVQEGVKEIARDSAWHSGRGSLGNTAEVLIILQPGQFLEASISGRRIQEDRARLTWDGTQVEVIFYDSESSLFEAMEEGGEYL